MNKHFKNICPTLPRDWNKTKNILLDQKNDKGKVAPVLPQLSTTP
jgi:hypothetical protein